MQTIASLTALFSYWITEMKQHISSRRLGSWERQPKCASLRVLMKQTYRFGSGGEGSSCSDNFFGVLFFVLKECASFPSLWFSFDNLGHGYCWLFLQILHKYTCRKKNEEKPSNCHTHLKRQYAGSHSSRLAVRAYQKFHLWDPITAMASRGGFSGGKGG